MRTFGQHERAELVRGAPNSTGAAVQAEPNVLLAARDAVTREALEAESRARRSKLSLAILFFKSIICVPVECCV